MVNNEIELKSIEELLKFNFFIPNYQRGYRWTQQQVKDLLNDIYEFLQNGASGIYCIQPLVVKKKYGNDLNIIQQIREVNDLSKVEEELAKATIRWDVIDGQQRLTTILILSTYLGISQKYSIEYETRKNSKEFLEKLSQIDNGENSLEKEAKTNIDFYHIFKTYQTIETWFKTHQKEKLDFTKVLLTKVKFIWYETKDPDPIKVFTRLNIGKIALTDAELIKALFLNSTNFRNHSTDKIRLQQIEIASEWDKIEYSLQNDEFWLFLHDVEYDRPTRIDFIFDLIKEKNLFLLKDYEESIGTDEHQTFRYFYEYFKLSKDKIDATWLHQTWKEIKKYFLIFDEWYNDLELYHYVGYLITLNHKISELVDLYKEKKSQFKDVLKEIIRGKIGGCKDLNKTYGEYGENKRECFPLLLLFNIQTVIDQNRSLEQDEKYGLGMTYKFPFHLFKKEAKKKNRKGWEVEHIASNSGDNLDSEKNQKAWLAAVIYIGTIDESLKTEIEKFLNDGENHLEFQEIRNKLKSYEVNPLTADNKQKIWNFALLDSTTNEEYQNDPFPIKRICILTKETGYKSIVKYNEKEHKIEMVKERSSAFVPPCTKNIFTKAYTDIPTNLGSWTELDAAAYKKSIFETLKQFGVEQ